MDHRMTKVEELFHAALLIEDTRAREDFLRDACGNDGELYEQVIELVRQAEGSTFFIDGAVSDPSETLARKLGKYDVLERLGKGGMGVVFAAYDPDLHRKVALKIPASLNLLSPQGLARFKAEARSVAALDEHPNIVRIHALELEHQPPFIVMEYLDGRDLGQVVTEKGPLSAQEAAKHVVFVAEGLRKAHENEIIHRDVKPQNVLVTVDGATKVLDLGLAKLPSSKVRTTTESINAQTDSQGGGSIEFISPEQSSSLANADCRSDIYSLGCTFYFLITGEVPFPNLDRDETIVAHCTAPRPSILKKVAVDATAPQLDAIIQKMMAIPAKDRPSSMSEVIDAVTDTLDQAAKRRRLKRKRMMTGAGVAAALLMLAWLVRSLIPPSYHFDLDKVADATEVNALVKIGDQVSTVTRWLTDYSKQSKQVARLLTNRDASDFKSCLVAGEFDGLGEINKALLVLDRFHEGAIPADWKLLNVERLTTEIESSLQAANQQDMIGRVENLVRKPETKLILDRWDIEQFPNVKFPSRQLQWITALQEAIEEGVRPTANWYETIKSTKEIEFGAGNETSLVIRQRINETRFQGENSVTSFDVWIRRTSDSASDDSSEADPATKQLIEVEPGIRLIDVALRRDEHNQAGIVWPPQGGVVDHSKLERFLHYHGLPESFKLSREVLQFDATTDRPAFKIDFDVTHEDFAQCSTSNQMTIDVGNQKLFAHDSRPYEELSHTLENQLELITNFRGFDLEVIENQRGSQCTGLLKIEGIWKLPCTVSLDSEFRVVIALQPTLAELDSFAKFICGQSEELRDLESYCFVSALHIDRENALLRGELSFSSIDHSAIPWAIDSTGAFDMVTPLTLATEVTTFRKEKKKEQKNRLSEDQLLQEIKKQLSNSRFKEYIEIGNVNCNSLANAFTLGIRIGDWPSVRLEPIEVSSIGDVKAAIDEALSLTNLSLQINQYWGIVSSHPRFGQAIATLRDLDPVMGQATVETKMLFAGGAIPLSVIERVALREQSWDFQVFNSSTGNWIPSNATTIGRFLQEETLLRALCDRVGAYASALTGMKVSVDPDDSIDSTWFRLGPPSMMFQARLAIPILNGTEMGIGKLRVSQDGVDVPNAVIFQPRFSVPCSYFTASDPRVEVDFEENQLKLGVKVTPLYPGVGPTASKAALVAYSVSDLPGSDVRWDNLFLHAGHVFVQIDGMIDSVGESTKSRYTFGAQGNVVALEDIRLAQCRGEMAILDWELDRLSLALDASLDPVGFDIGRLEGEFTLIPDRGLMRLDGSVDINGLFLAGDLDYQSSGSGDRRMLRIGEKLVPGGVAVDARADIPLIGSTRVTGASNFSFQDYCLKSTGTVPVPFTESYWRYDATVTQVNTKIKWTWVTPSGETVTYTTESPRVDLIDADELVAELKSAYEISSEADLREASPTITPRGSSKGSDSKGSENGKDFKSTVPSVLKRDDYDMPAVDLQVDGEYLKAVYAATPQQELGRISAKEIGVTDWRVLERWVGWTPADEYAVFCVQEETSSTQGKIHTLLYRPDGTVRAPAIELLTSEVEFANSSGALRPRGSDPKVLMARATLLDSIEFRLHGYQEVEISSIENGYIVSAKDGAYESLSKSYTVLPDQSNLNRFTYIDLPPSVLRKSIDAFSEGIVGIQGDQYQESIVVAANFDGPTPEAAVIRRLSRDRFALQVQHNGNISEHTMERVDGVSAYEVYKVARKFAESVWTKNVVPEELVYVGDAGASVAFDDGWLLLPADSLSDVRLPSFVRLSKNDFVKGWTEFGNQLAESEALLPATLRSREKRSRCHEVSVARSCVLSWNELKKETDREQRWFAHPMGLLIELALLNQNEN